MASSITTPVGRGAANANRADVLLIQKLLNNHRPVPLRQISASGNATEELFAAIEEFQHRVVKMHHPDGRVDPQGHTLAALADNGKSPATPANAGLPAPGAPPKLTDGDFVRVGNLLKCDVAAIKAVNDVESGGSGFFASGRPKILFEAHIFSKLTGHKFDTTNPDISSRAWNRSLYKHGEHEYGRLEKAMALDRGAALQSASWGRFQIMGFHYRSLGYGSVDAYVADMYRSEGKQLDAFAAFIRANHHLATALREKRWTDFARGYNGGGYLKNRYDERLKAAYQKYAPAAGSKSTLP